MISPVSTLRPILPLWYRLLSAIGFIGAGITICIGLVLLASSAVAILSWGSIIIAASLYLLSQAIRAVRLAIIVGDPGKSLRQLVQAHFVGASASFCLPYKIGDLLRIIELSFVLRRDGNLGLWRGILVMWIERVYDALPIALLLLFLGATVGKEAFIIVAPILAALVTFIIVTLLTFFVLPENLDGLALFLARRYHGARVVTILRSIDRLYRLTADAKRMLHRKHITLLTCSTLIWAGEIATVSLIFDQGTLRGSATDLLRFLSGLLSPSFSHQSGQIGVYSATIGIPFLLLGLLAWLGALIIGRLRLIAWPQISRRLQTQSIR
jgi:hypothetical protein